jgi:hypothetical protein
MQESLLGGTRVGGSPVNGARAATAAGSMGALLVVAVLNVSGAVVVALDGVRGRVPGCSMACIRRSRGLLNGSERLRT